MSSRVSDTSSRRGVRIGRASVTCFAELAAAPAVVPNALSCFALPVYAVPRSSTAFLCSVVAFVTALCADVRARCFSARTAVASGE